uniref:PRANC domain-containing protein n=1 Tax=Trichogramma kaykai TaxID=54128 RepID=A0ABD2W197_9HYME
MNHLKPRPPKKKKNKNRKRTKRNRLSYIFNKDNSKNYNSNHILVHQTDLLSNFVEVCKNGDVSSVAYFLRSVNPNSIVDDMGYSPLHVSLEYGQKEVLKVLLRNGANPNLLSAKNSHPLHVICKRDKDEKDLAKLFFDINDELENPVHVNTKDNMGNTPLHRALQWAYTKLARLLLKKGADPNLANEDGKTPLHIISTGYRSEKLVKLFFNINKDLGHTLQIDAKDKWGQTPLQLAVKNRLPDVIEVLLDNGASPSGIVFPLANYFEKSLVPDLEKCHWKLCLVSDVLAVLELLEDKGYDVDRNCALKVMELFIKYELVEKSVDDNNSWYNESFAKLAKKIMIKPNLSLNQLLQLQPKEEEKLLKYSDYFDFGCSRKLNYLLRSHRDDCSLRLCEQLSRRFFRPWTQAFFMEMMHNQLPQECCELVVDESLMCINLYDICLTIEGLSQKKSK